MSESGASAHRRRPWLSAAALAALLLTGGIMQAPGARSEPQGSEEGPPGARSEPQGSEEGPPPEPGGEARIYRSGKASQDGIGKFYMGREISFVMGHAGAEWLERPERELEERPDEVIANLGLAPDAIVADIGAGTGYFSLRLARAVPQGRVLAVDIQPEMLAELRARLAKTELHNVVPVLGTITDPGLEADSVDLALLVDTYHEFSHPYEMMSALAKALRPGGRVALVEYRGEDASIPIYPLHKLTQAQARAEMAAVGLRWLEARDFLPQQHLMIFEKPRADAAAPAERKPADPAVRADPPARKENP